MLSFARDFPLFTALPCTTRSLFNSLLLLLSPVSLPFQPTHPRLFRSPSLSPLYTVFLPVVISGGSLARASISAPFTPILLSYIFLWEYQLRCLSLAVHVHGYYSRKKINHGMVRRRKTIDIGTLRIIIDRSNIIAVYRTRLASVNRHAVRSAYCLRNRKVSRDPPSFFLSLSSRGAPTISTLMPVSLRLDSTLRSVPLPRPPNTVPLPCHQLRVYPSLSLSLSYPFLALAIPLTRFSVPPAFSLPVTQFSRSPTADFPPLHPFIPYFSVSRLKTTVHTLPVAFCPTQCVASIISTTNVYRYRLRLLFLFFPPSLSLS